MENIFLKNYSELTTEEKNDMLELFENEEGFNQIKFINDQIKVIKLKEDNLELKPKIKENLDHLFQQVHGNKNQISQPTKINFLINKDKKWWEQNLTKIAALLIAILTIIPFWKYSNLDKVQVSEAKFIQKEKKINLKENTKDLGNKTSEVISESKINSTPKNNLKQHSVEQITSKIKNVEPLTSFQDNTVSINVAAAPMMAESSHPDGIYSNLNDTTFQDVKTSNQHYSLSKNKKLLDLISVAY
jgi:hypothetical protein